MNRAITRAKDRAWSVERIDLQTNRTKIIDGLDSEGAIRLYGAWVEEFVHGNGRVVRWDERETCGEFYDVVLRGPRGPIP